MSLCFLFYAVYFHEFGAGGEGPFMLTEFIIFIRNISSNLNETCSQYVIFFSLSLVKFCWPLLLYMYFSFLKSSKSITRILIATL